MLSWTAGAMANPTGAQVAAGAASFQTSGKTLTVTNTPGTILNWSSFSIAAGEVTRFQQQSALSAVLNRVTGANPSSILGTLSSNGRVFLVNPHGIVFGQGSVINTAGFVASTLNISDADFLAGRMKFEGGGHGVLRNEGAIQAAGDIFLVGPRIENAGLIKSDNGSVLLAAGQAITITSPDAHGVQFALQAPTDSALNLGVIEAKNAAGMFAGTLKHSGDIRATSASVDASGRVVLAAQKDAILDGNATINVDNIAGKGGAVQITGERVGLFDNATVTARGVAGGGTILVGGDYQGANPAVRNAARTFVGSGAVLDASATSSGDGGKIIVWADDVTRYFGSAAVRGGAQGGDGGLVEVSGKNALVFEGRVGLEAVNGRSGTLLLDPLNITVQAGAGTLDGELSAPGDPLLAFAEPDNVTTGTLSVASLQAFTTGTVELQANNNITFDAAVTMQSGVSLKAAAMNNVNVNANITTSGGGVLRLEADTDQSGAGVVNLGTATINAPLIIGDTGKEFSGNANITGNFSFGGNTQVFGQLNLSTGSMTVATGQTLSLTGGMNWATSAGINGPGTVTLPSGQTLTLAGNADRPLVNATFNNNGTVVSQDAGANLLINDGSVFNNAGVYRIVSGASITRNSGAGTFNNTGELEIGGAITGTVSNVTFTNTGGTLDSGTGTLDLGAGGSHSGALTIQGNHVRLNSGTHTFADSTTVAGRLNVVGGTASFGTVTVNGLVNYTSGGINVTAGDTLTLNGGMSWATASGISGPGTITLPTGQTLTLVSNIDRPLVNATFNNNGTVVSQDAGSNLLINDSSVFNNAGVYRFQTGGAITRNSGAGTFNNTGEVEGVAGNNQVNNVTFTNAGGTLDSGPGTLELNSGGSHSGALTMQGNNVRLNGGTHTFADSTTIAGILNVTGGGTASFGTVAANGLVNYTGGGFNVTAGDTLTLNAGMNWSEGFSIAGPGTVVLPAGQTLATAGGGGSRTLVNVTFNNNGTFDSGSNGSVLVNDNSVFNNAGLYRFLNAGNFISRNSGAGTFNNTGTIQVGGAFPNNINNVTFTNTGGILDSGTGTLNLNAGGSHSGALTMQGSNVFLAGGTHDFADGATVAGRLNVDGGTASFGTVTTNGLVTYDGVGFNVTAADTLTLNGGMNWTAGDIGGPGTIVLPAGQTLAMSNAGNRAMVNVVFNNNGTVTSQIGAQLLINDGSVFNNAGVYRFLDSSVINRTSGTGAFNNTGEIEVVGAFNGFVSGVALTNTSGTLDSGTGMLRLDASGTHSGALTLQGTNVQLNAGTHTFADGTTVSGTLNVQGSATASFGTVTMNGLVNYSNGGFNVTAGDTLTLNAGMNWTGAGISGPGAITLPAGQTLAISAGGGSALVNVTFNNNGTVTSQINGGSVLINDGSVFNNAGVFRFLTGDAINRTSGTGVFNNTGEIEVGGAFTASMANVTFTNTAGTLDSGTGTLNLNAGGSHSGALTMQGTGVQMSGGTHDFADTTTVAGQLNVSAGGIANFGTVTTNGLVSYSSGGSGFNVTAGDTLTLNAGMNWAGGGNVSGPGTVTLPAGQTLAMAGGGGNRALVNVTFNNNGTVTSQLGTQGLLVNDGTVFNNAGMYRFLSGDFITRNSGTGTFNNTGEIEVGGAFTGTMNNVVFSNTSATLDAGTGIFNLDGGGSYTGTMTLQGANVRLNGGTHNIADGVTVAGQLNVTSGATANFGTVITNGLVNYAATGLNVTAGDTLTLNGGMNWTSGNVSGPGTVTLPAGQTLAMTNTSTHALVNATFNNNGTVTSQIGGQNLLINDGSVFNNAGVYRFLGSDAIARTSGAGTFNNTGTMQVVGAFTGTVNDVAFSNTGGTLDSGAGTLNLTPGGNHSGALTMQGGNVRLAAGTHNFADGTTVAGQLNVAGGTASFGTVTTNGLVNYTAGGLNITAGDTLTLNGGMNWVTGANIFGPGAITLPTGQTMAMTNAGGNALVNAIFNNNGTVTSQFNAGQNFLLNDGTVFNNAGVYRFLDTNTIVRTSGVGTFNNSGTLQVNGAFTGTMNNVVFSNNGGTLDSGAGTLNINVGGAHSGTMTVQGADVRFNAGTHIFTTASFAGSGAINIQGAGFTLSNTNWNRPFNLTSGTVTIPAATTTTVPAGANIAINHAVGGTGTMLNQGTVDLSGGSLAGTLNNQGALNLTSGNTTVGGGISMVSGAINVATARTLNVAGTGVDWQGGTLSGAGSYNLTGGLAITGGGARVLNGPTLNLGATTLGGSLNVQSGALNFGGIATIGPAATLELTGGTVTGALAVDVQGLLKMNGGVLNAASVGLVPGATLSGSGGTINAPVVNGGTVAVGASPGTLVVNGNYSQTPTGVLNVELGGTTQGVNYDLLQVNGTASLGGTMNVSMFGGFTGAVGNVFDVITYTSRTGDFTTINFPPGFGMSAAPNATFYQLALASVPAVAAGPGGATEAAILKLLAGETKILNDKFLATVDAGKQPEEEEKKGAVLECI
ncbi:MAG: filamentous hemagglutinin N-terminal domain-containing protein [Burkholderiales bacterium]|nr:filamentous hemagglutinin N-terminal domain-containing protein [Burkholderiales bacterium]